MIYFNNIANFPDMKKGVDEVSRLDEATKENLDYMLKEIASKLQVVNQSIMDPADYDLNKYDQLKLLYDVLRQKGKLSVSETQAFVQELASIRK